MTETLTVAINADARGLLSTVANVNKALLTVGDGAHRLTSRIGGALSGLAGSFKGFVGPMVLATASFKTFSSVADSLQRSEVLQKTANDLELTTNALQKLNYAAETNASSAASMGMALRNMLRFVNDVREGGEGASDTLRKMGYSVDAFSGKDTSEIFAMMSDGLNRLSTASEKAALGQQVFGRQAKDIGEVLRLGSSGLKDMGEEAERLNRILSDLDLANISVAREKAEEAGRAMTHAADKATSTFAPAIYSASEAWTYFVDSISDGAGYIFRGISEAASILVDSIVRVFKSMDIIITGTFELMGASIEQSFWGATRAITKAAIWLGDKVSDVWGVISAGFTVSGKAIIVSWEMVKEKIISIASDIGVAVGRHMHDMGMAMINTGIKGVMESGEKLSDMGGKLIVGASRLGTESSIALTVAKDGLVKAREDLGKAWAGAADMSMNVDTPKLDQFYEAADKTRVYWLDNLGRIPDTLADMWEKSNLWRRLTGQLTEFEEQVQSTLQGANAEGGGGAQGNGWVRMANSQLFSPMASARDIWMEEHSKKMMEFYERMAELDSEDKEIQAARQSQFNAQKLINETESVDAQVMLWRSGAMGKLQSLQGVFGNLSTLMQSENKKMFEIGRAAALASNVVDTIQSAASSYKFGAEIGGPIVGAAFAATAVLAGLVRAQQLVAARPPGSGGGSMPSGGGGGGTGAVAARGASEESRTNNVNVTLYGDSFSGSQVRGMISMINDATDDNFSLKAQVGR